MSSFNPNPLFTWARKGGYEISSIGDKRYSAFYAKLASGETIEHIYQCHIKGYKSIKEGKGKKPLNNMSHHELWLAYLKLWEQWSIENEDDLFELALLATANNYTLSDTFASTPINQARALSHILNKTFGVD